MGGMMPAVQSSRTAPLSRSSRPLLSRPAMTAAGSCRFPCSSLGLMSRLTMAMARLGSVIQARDHSARSHSQFGDLVIMLTMPGLWHWRSLASRWGPAMRPAA